MVKSNVYPVTHKQALAALQDFVKHRLEHFGTYQDAMAAETEMNCIHICIRQLIDHAYAHHIQRLMVMGLFALLICEALAVNENRFLIRM